MIEMVYYPIRDNGKQRHIGMFDSAIEAAKAYDKAAIKCRGSKAELNFPQTPVQKPSQARNRSQRVQFVTSTSTRDVGMSQHLSSQKLSQHKHLQKIRSNYHGVHATSSGRWQVQIR